MKFPITAKRLRAARLKVGLSQAQVGLRAGIDPSDAGSRMNQYERGRHEPTLQMAQRIAQVLQVPAPYLYAEDDELANWILAFDHITPRARKTLIRKASQEVVRTGAPSVLSSLAVAKVTARPSKRPRI